MAGAPWAWPCSSAALLVFGVRLWILRVLDFNTIKRRVLVVGAGEAAAKIRRLRRRSDRRQFDVVGFIAVTDEERRIAAELDIEPLLTPEEARATRRLDEIVVALDDRRGYLPLEFLLHQKQRGVPVSDVMDFLERETERLDLDILRPSWLLYEKSSQTDILYRWLKRLFDLVFSSGLLLLTSPALLLTMLAIRIEDGAGGAGVLPAAPRWAQWPRVRSAEVPEHARQCREGHRAALCLGQRRPGHPHRPAHPPLPGG